MIENCGHISTDHLAGDRYTGLQRLEDALNQTIVQAEISESYEEYLEIFDAFYADNIAVTRDTLQEPIRGRSRVRGLLANFLAPLHSPWTLELIGVSGNTCKVSWRVFRKWRGSLVSYEHHYDYERSGAPLTSKDLYSDAASVPAKQPVS
jgi:hypothetical protein